MKDNWNVKKKKNEIIDFFMFRFVNNPSEITDYERHVFISGGICALILVSMFFVAFIAVWPSTFYYTV